MLRTPRHWYIHTGDGYNLQATSDRGLYGLNSNSPCVKRFLRLAQKGDQLWFIVTPKITIATATLDGFEQRVSGSLLGDNDEDRGWYNPNKINYDIDIYYKNLYDLRDITKLKIGMCNSNMPREYSVDKGDPDLHLILQIIQSKDRPVELLT